jgi:hypothetical protein
MTAVSLLRGINVDRDKSGWHNSLPENHQGELQVLHEISPRSTTVQYRIAEQPGITSFALERESSPVYLAGSEGCGKAQVDFSGRDFLTPRHAFRVASGLESMVVASLCLCERSSLLTPRYVRTSGGFGPMCRDSACAMTSPSAFVILSCCNIY